MEATYSTLTERTDVYFEDYLKSTDCPKLQIGSGKYFLEGWFNTDIISGENIYYLDLLKRFNFPDNTFNYIFSEHNIEHFTIEQIAFILNECNRVLKPGGVLRISTPDLRKLINFYLEDSDLHERYCKYQTDHSLPTLKNSGVYNKAFVLNDFFRNWGHKVIFDYESLEVILSILGYVDIKPVKLKTSEHKELKGIEKHDQDFVLEFNELETMTIEAMKKN